LDPGTPFLFPVKTRETRTRPSGNLELVFDNGEKEKKKVLQ
jgi:hypothetical protein